MRSGPGNIWLRLVNHPPALKKNKRQGHANEPLYFFLITLFISGYKSSKWFEALGTVGVVSEIDLHTFVSDKVAGHERRAHRIANAKKLSRTQSTGAATTAREPPHALLAVPPTDRALGAIIVTHAVLNVSGRTSMSSVILARALACVAVCSVGAIPIRANRASADDEVAVLAVGTFLIDYAWLSSHDSNDEKREGDGLDRFHGWHKRMVLGRRRRERERGVKWIELKGYRCRQLLCCGKQRKKQSR